jgi:outer membrane receptor protein involved in Fe transport
LAGVVVAQPGAGPKAGAVIGQVFDSELTSPIEYANVVLYALPESTQVTGTVTDKSGAFRLDGVKPGRYYVELSFIGYRDRSMKEIEVTAGAQFDLGRIGLELKPISVPGVEAVGVKPAISYEIDKKVIDVSKLPNATSGTAVDALRNVPSVKVDIEDNVTLRGSSSFKVLIDGKPTLLDANEALKQTPAQTIDKIEIITNPSAKYEPDGAAGIINILLKKQKGRGISALANANGGLNGSFGGDALLSLRQGIANTYAGGNIGRYTSAWNSESDDRRFSPADTLSIMSTGSGHWRGLFGSGRAGLDLQFGPRDKSSVSGRVGGFEGRSEGSSDKIERRLPGDSSRHYQTRGLWDFSRRFYFITADHQHDFDTTGHKLTASAYMVNRGGGGVSGNEELDSTGTDTTGGRRTEELGPMRRANLELGYTLPVREKDRLEAGFQSRLERTDQDYRLYNYSASADSYELDERSSHPYYGTQDIHSLFATYSWNWRGLGLQPGLRGEYGDRVITVTDMDTTWKISRWDYFPSLHATYGLPSGQQVTASYSRRIDRPDPWYLRPFPVWYDAHTVSVGNPELRPSYANSWELGCELPLGENSLSAEGYWRTTSDMVEWITTKYPEDTTVLRYTEDTTVLLQTSRNVGRDRSIGVELTANVSPVKWFTAYVTGDLSDYYEEGTLFGQDFSRRIFYWSSSANLTFRLPTNTSIQLDGNFSGPSITATSTDDGWIGTNLAVRQTMLNRALSVTARLSNLFGASTQHSKSEGKGFLTRSAYVSEGLTFSLAVSYNFNNFKFDPKMRAGEGVEQGGAGGGAGGGRP